MGDVLLTTLGGIIGAVITLIGVIIKTRIDGKRVNIEHDNSDRENTREDFKELYSQMQKTIERQEQTITRQGERIDKLEQEIDEEREANKERERLYEQRINELNQRYMDEVAKTRDLQEQLIRAQNEKKGS